MTGEVEEDGRARVENTDDVGKSTVLVELLDQEKRLREKESKTLT